MKKPKEETAEYCKDCKAKADPLVSPNLGLIYICSKCKSTRTVALKVVKGGKRD